MRAAVALYMTRAAEKLRRHHLAARVVTVFINTNRFSPEPQYANSVTFGLAYATDSTNELLDWALKGLERIHRGGYQYKKAGVMLSHLVPADSLSIRLYGDERFERSRRLMKAIDLINSRHGKDTVRYGLLQPGGRWATRFTRKSPCYMTCLREVLCVH